jgi:hypothetical protein
MEIIKLLLTATSRVAVFFSVLRRKVYSGADARSESFTHLTGGAAHEALLIKGHVGTFGPHHQGGRGEAETSDERRSSRR